MIDARSARSSYASTMSWSKLADWIARQDRAIPLYHSVCLKLWLWAFRHSV